MKDKKYVISSSNLPKKFQLGSIVLTFLALDHWNAPEWLWGAFIALWIILGLARIYDMFNQEEVDVLTIENLSDQFIKTMKKNAKKSFDERMEEMEKKKKDEAL